MKFLVASAFVAGVAAFGSSPSSGMSADERRTWFASSNGEVTTRRNAISLSKAERQACVDAWWAMKDIPSMYDPSMNAYDYFPYNHQKWAGNATHGHPGFGPWHRVFIRQFELEMQRASGNPNLFVPYVDLWDQAAMDDLTGDGIIGGDGSGPDGQYIVKEGSMAYFTAPEKTTIFTPPGDEAFSQEYLTRNIAHVNTPDWFESTIKMPTKMEIDAMLELPVYDCGSMDVSAPRSCSFRVVLEGWPQDENDQYNADVQTYPWPMHAAFHTYIGGNMDSLASPCDPLFFFLHCAVDRLWYSYQIKHGSATHPEPDMLIGGTTMYETTGANLAGLQMTPRKTFDPVEMGFRYMDVEGDTPQKADMQRRFFESSNGLITTRRNVGTMSKAERQACVDAWWAMKEMPSTYDPSMNAYDYFPYNHQKWAANQTHGHPGFGPWHRVFIRQFELEMQRASGNPNLFQPYVDIWDKSAVTNLVMDGVIGGDGAGPARQYRVIRGGMANFPAPEKTTIFTPPGDDAFSQEYLTRNIRHVNTPDWFESTIKMPTKPEIRAMLQLPVYDCGSMDVSAPRACSFRVVVEGWPQDENDQYNDDVQTYPWPMHAAFHTYIGGNMDSLASPCDPLFFFLHCAVDRLWYSWTSIHGSASHPDVDALIGGTTRYTDPLAQLKLTPRDTFEPIQMGFRYADIFEA